MEFIHRKMALIHCFLLIAAEVVHKDVKDAFGAAPMNVSNTSGLSYMVSM